MALYAVGDLQGCFEPLQRLLDQIAFDPSRDQVWFTGDLVNRGPDSLACLRFVKALGERSICVLGNHDLHLLCVAAGVEKRRPRDTLEAVLDAPDRDELLDWLRHRPLLHVSAGNALVHAGLLPQWSVERAQALAAEVEGQLRGPSCRELLSGLYGDAPDRWHEGLAGIERWRVVVNAMTRLRVCDREGAMVLRFKGAPADAQGEWLPWFDVPGRASADHTVIFGHWSALGLRVEPNVLALDSGCVWGRALTAVRLDDRTVHSVQCPGGQGRED